MFRLWAAATNPKVAGVKLGDIVCCRARAKEPFYKDLLSPAEK